MSETKKIEEITPKQISDRGVQALADRPNAQARYGVGGLSAPQLKLWFDKLATFLAGKINEITKAISGKDAADYVGLDLDDVGISNLGDLIAAFKNGTFAREVVKVFPTEGSDTGYPLTEILDEVLSNEANGIKSVIYNSTNSSIVIERNGGGQISVSLKPIIEAVESKLKDVVDGNTYVGCAKFSEFANEAQCDLIGNIIHTTYAKKSDITKLYRAKGSVTSYDELLLVINAEVGDCYNVKSEFKVGNDWYPAGTNVVYTDEGWDVLAGFVDLSEIEAALIHNLEDGGGNKAVTQVGNNATAERAFATGWNTSASGPAAFTSGGSTSATAANSSAGGRFSKATHDNSHAGGEGTQTSRKNQTVYGEWNAPDTEALFIVGNGSDDGHRSNALAVRKDGTLLAGDTPIVTNIVDGTGNCSVQQASTKIALPDRNRATGPYAAAFGDGTSAIEDGAFSTGIRTHARHRGSFSAGNGTLTTREYQMVIGTHNDTSIEDALFMVGNSESAFAPSNAFVVKEDGQAIVGALPQEPMAVATKSITDGLDERVSYLESFNLEYIVNSTDNGVLSIPSNQYLGKKAFLNTVGGKSLIWNGYEGVYDPYDSSKNFNINLGDIELPAGSYTIRDYNSGADLQKLLTCIVKYVPKDTPEVGEQTLNVSGMSTITVPFDIILKSMWCNSLIVATIYPYFVNLSTGDVLFIPGSWPGFKSNKPEEIRVYSTANKYSSIHIPDGDGFGYGYDNIVNSIDFDTQTYTKRCDIVIIDGSESYWNWNGSYTNGYAFIYTPISNVAPEMALDDESLPISDLFGSVIPYNEAVASNAIMCKTDESVIGFWILKYDLWELSPSEDTLEGFREWLNRRPVSILFALKTPAVRDISYEGLSGLIDVTAGGRIEVVSELGISGTLQATFVVPRE